MSALNCIRRAATCGALFVVGALLLHGVARAAQPTYVDHVRAGLTALQSGKPDVAAEELRAAMRLDANHPAAWNAYGALLLGTRNVDAARRCFERAAALAPSLPRPQMGLALCDLAAGQVDEADRRFAEAAHRGAPAADLHRAYLAAMRTEAVNPSPPPGPVPTEEQPLALALRAYTAGPNGLHGWEDVLASLEASRGPLLASFTPWKPFNHGWQARPRLPMPPSAPAQAVSGAVPLTGEVSADTRHVLFTVDGVVAGVTNVRPFQWTWDTAAYPNGWHTVKVTAVRADGSSVSKERRVWTKNQGAADPPEYEGIEQVNAALDRALALQPDARYARYVLARAAMDAQNTDEARRRLRDIVGDDPKYWNAPALLKALPRTAGTAEIWRGPSGSRRIALTFDDGPNQRRTPPLLDLLDRLKVPATFFLVGKQAAAHPEMVRRMAASGHEVENHTWNHPNMAKLSEPEAMRELAATSRLLAELTGRAPRYFRPPGGNTGAEVREAASALGMSPAMWTFASGKYEGLAVEEMTPAFVNAARPGAIYLVHNGTDKILEVLPAFVAQLRAGGYEFVTLEELLSDGGADAGPVAPPIVTAGTAASRDAG